MAREDPRLRPPGRHVLSRRELNRTLLSRQLLLRRAAVTVRAAIEHLVGLQAQAPRAPYVALWSRLEGFEPDDLERLLTAREVARVTGLLRTTIHLATAEDALALRPVLQGESEKAVLRSPFQRALAGVDLDAVRAAGRAILEEGPIGIAELGKRLAAAWPGRDATSLGMVVRDFEPMVQVPPRGLWRAGGSPRLARLESWLGRPMRAPQVEPFVLRYLAAFGPATPADVATWSGLTGVREILERLRPSLRTYADDAGRELFDVADGAIADPEIPAPPRFLPEYDNVLLSHADRSRIHDPTWKVPLAPGDGARLGTFLVDGFVAGTWRLSLAAPRPILTLAPLEPVPGTRARELEEEAIALAAFITGGASSEVRIAP